MTNKEIKNIIEKEVSFNQNFSTSRNDLRKKTGLTYWQIDRVKNFYKDHGIDFYNNELEKEVYPHKMFLEFPISTKEKPKTYEKKMEKKEEKNINPLKDLKFSISKKALIKATGLNYYKVKVIEKHYKNKGYNFKGIFYHELYTSFPI